MVRSRRESHHSDGITDPNNLQQISATKSAQSGHPSRATECPLSAVKRTSTGGNPMSAFDPKRTLNDQLQKRWFELVPPYGSGVLHLLTAAFGTKRPLDKS